MSQSFKFDIIIYTIFCLLIINCKCMSIYKTSSSMDKIQFNRKKYSSMEKNTVESKEIQLNGHVFQTAILSRSEYEYI